MMRGHGASPMDIKFKSHISNLLATERVKRRALIKNKQFFYADLMLKISPSVFKKFKNILRSMRKLPRVKKATSKACLSR